MEDKRNLRKERIGVVTSDSMDKTVTVIVSRRVKHPMYGKFITYTTKFMLMMRKMIVTVVIL